MPNTSHLNDRWTGSILWKNGWQSRGQLFDQLNSIAENKYTESNLGSKDVFIQRIRRLIMSIELDGDAVKEAKQMTAPGSIFDSLNYDYLFMRSKYLEKRKKLKELLSIVARVLTA
jgi:hypothetical protein